jgi:hypothetical protein
MQLHDFFVLLLPKHYNAYTRAASSLPLEVPVVLLQMLYCVWLTVLTVAASLLCRFYERLGSTCMVPLQSTAFGFIFPE